MQLSARILTALAVLTLLVAYVAGGGASPSVEAATGQIDVLNVGTCFTTDDGVFSVNKPSGREITDGKIGKCDDGDGNEDYDVAGRKTITEVDNVYATYAVDPRTSAEAPRAILTNSDLIKIVIEDEGRDKRTGVLYRTDSPLDGGDDYDTNGAGTLAVDPDTPTWKSVIEGKTKKTGITPEAGTTRFDNGVVEGSGEVTFTLGGPASTENPLARDGKVYWFGVRKDSSDAERGQRQAFGSAVIGLDEDKSQGDENAPWFRARVSVPEDQDIDIKYIYYETSDKEILRGGDKYLTINEEVDSDALEAYRLTLDPTDRAAATDDPEDDNDVGPLDGDTDPKYTSDEQETDGKALVVEARADGDTESVNLWLEETNKFSGKYAGYLRLTDADGDGSEKCGETDANDNRLAKENWGRVVCDAEDETVRGAAVLGVQSGPVKIRYRDTDGDTQEVEILIDTGAPTVQIVSPEHKSSGRDDSPIVDGTFADGDSGLREDSFRIYGDNTDDNDEDGENGFESLVFNLGVRDTDPTDNVIEGNRDRGVVVPDPDGEAGQASENKKVELRGHYAGYHDSAPTDDESKPEDFETFGIIPAEAIYFDNDRVTGADDGDDIRDEVKQAEADDFEDGDKSGTFDSTIRFDYKTGSDQYNNAVDIQAVVLDIAGNIGFSDSDPSAPTFIHDFGTDKKDRKADQHNVIGWYSRHIYYLDEVNPTFEASESATGFFGEDDDDKAMASKSGLMVVFDGNIQANSVSTDTFAVTLDGGDAATVTDIAVEGKRVYLMLDTELEPDATPQVEIASGETVEDLAGNESSFRDEEVEKFELSDGILPTLTIALSGGSGLNEGSEGPSQLTKDNITITITSDERLQGAPRFAVVCSSLAWDGDDDDKATEEDNNVDKYASNRSGPMTNAEYGRAEPLPYVQTSPQDSNLYDRQITCGYDEPGDSSDANTTANDKKRFTITETSALARPGNTWEYQWSNLAGETNKVEDGKLTVVATGRDRSSYKRGSDTIFNRASSTAEFTYDNTFESPLDDNDGEVIPGKGESVTEPRPFILLDFAHEKTSVDVTLMEVDGDNVVDELRELDDNRFVYWPESLEYGSYSVKVEANDAANKSLEFNYSFSVNERTPFGLNLLAGWNAISFPANPEDRTLSAVFTLPEIDQVIGWDPTDPSPWRMATKIEGVWTTNQNDAALNDVQARYGYWVHSTSFVTQYVTLVGKGDRENDGPPRPEDLVVQDGWNFVGVLDQDGDQTQSGAFGTGLRNSSRESVSAGDYLGDYTRAYTWDHTNNEWNVLRKDEFVSIGSGIWVYFTEGKHIAP